MKEVWMMISGIKIANKDIILIFNSKVFFIIKMKIIYKYKFDYNNILLNYLTFISTNISQQKKLSSLLICKGNNDGRGF